MPPATENDTRKFIFSLFGVTRQEIQSDRGQEAGNGVSLLQKTLHGSFVGRQKVGVQQLQQALAVFLEN